MSANHSTRILAKYQYFLCGPCFYVVIFYIWVIKFLFKPCGCVRMPLVEDQRSAQRERLFFVEFLLVFLGRIGRKELVGQFEISEPAATKDLSLYSEFAPDMLHYDRRQKCYIYARGTLRFSHDVDRSLFALAGERAITQYSGHTKRLISSVGASIKRQVPLDIASPITRCMHQRRGMSAVYKSLGGGERERLLSPLALIHDGLRWHIRCYDHEAGLYKDHNLARFVSVSEGEQSEADRNSDPEWNQRVELKLVAHPKSEHPETVRLDYGIDDDVKSVSLRSCLVGYFLRRWPIDYTDDATDDPRYHQLYLANKQELIEHGVDEWAFK